MLIYRVYKLEVKNFHGLNLNYNILVFLSKTISNFPKQNRLLLHNKIQESFYDLLVL